MPALDPVLIFAIATSIIYILLLGAVFRRTIGGDRSLLILTVVLILGLSWSLSLTFPRLALFSGIRIETLKYRIPFYHIITLTLLFYALTRSFTRRQIPWWFWALGLAWLVLTVIIYENFLGTPEEWWLGGNRTLPRSMGNTLIIGPVWAFLVISGYVILVREYKQLTSPLHKNRFRYWMLGQTLMAIGGGLALFNQRIVGGTAFLLANVAVTYVLTTYRPFDLREGAGRFSVFLINTVLAVGIYSVGFWAASWLVHLYYTTNAWLIWAGMGVVLTLLVSPLLMRTHRWLTDMIFGSGYDARDAVREYSASINNILSLEQLTNVITGFMQDTFQVKHSQLVLVNFEEVKASDPPQGYYLLKVVASGEGLPTVAIMADDSPVGEYLRNARIPLTQYEIDVLPRFRETAGPERTWLAGLSADVYVPIFSKGQWVGLLALGAKTSGERFYDNDLALLSTIADQTAVALENARLFDDLRQRNEENEHLNLELTEAYQELERLDQAKSNFLNIASHELRTPLTQVRGYTDMLNESISEKNITPETAGIMAQGLRKATLRLESIVDIMFDVSRVETGTLELDLVPLGMASVLQLATDAWQDALRRRKISVNIVGVDNLPTIQGDLQRLKQAFSNVIQNAIKYTPNGGHIQISGYLLTNPENPEEQAVEIIIADTGIGIEPAELERIFDAFYGAGDPNLHSTGDFKFKGGGPGLGLTITRGIIDAHGGRVWAESPGYDETHYPGSKFHILIPVNPPTPPLA
jgi:signal transduction histidine kinase